ncbi:hypothetical protein [Kerstersia gyiorum]|uniref:hypothetical protein n=1 Tax=Kerstersia gyiorum TaxID=206506 RepID=UPI0010711002|nr:hypothetical protein [Kerstersia gyiorum]MCO7635754.1 hypothetical protein [Pseudomonas sp. S 311-6]MCP1632256.1 hypothetical protein [Kerstersia gyiorum]MCP1635237.1 hypothetical protein [Kerstersia gyiorum]MCP1669836.1 hypothetical protein [Kerstersia gyiorum]MCP1677975.1 hypothetical protein [Kerstersia gyiorum]
MAWIHDRFPSPSESGNDASATGIQGTAKMEKTRHFDWPGQPFDGPKTQRLPVGTRARLRPFLKEFADGFRPIFHILKCRQPLLRNTTYGFFYKKNPRCRHFHHEPHLFFDYFFAPSLSIFPAKEMV